MKNNDTKPGLKTTEFWGCIFTVVIILLTNLVGKHVGMDQWQIIIASLSEALIALGYTNARATVKKGSGDNGSTEKP